MMFVIGAAGGLVLGGLSVLWDRPWDETIVAGALFCAFVAPQIAQWLGGG